MTIFGVLLTLLLSCPFSDPGEGEQDSFLEWIDRNFEVEVGELKGENQGAACESFSLDEEGAEFFLSHARIVDGYTFGKEYPWFPCWAEGLILTSENTYKWKIGPGATGTIHLGEEECVYLVCEEKCQDLFPEGGRIFDE